MRSISLLFLAVLTHNSLLCAADPPKEGDPFAKCEDKFPDGVRAAYLKFLAVRNAKEPEVALKALCLPGLVRMTSEKRKKDNEHIGEDINLPFFLKGFNPEVMFVRKWSDDVYLVRTWTSGIRFVQTKSGGWMACEYFDHPPY